MGLDRARRTAVVCAIDSFLRVVAREMPRVGRANLRSFKKEKVTVSPRRAVPRPPVRAGKNCSRPRAPCHNIEIAKTKDARMSSLLKVGVMGYGLAGATFHAPVIEHCGRATVAAIAT